MNTFVHQHAATSVTQWVHLWLLLSAALTGIEAGVLDESFDLGLPATNYVWSVVSQQDGRIIVSGKFTSIQDVPRLWIARLNSNATVDTTFDPANALGVLAATMVLQPDGKIVIGGRFTTVAGTELQKVARLDTNGAVDGTFRPPSRITFGATNLTFWAVNTLVLQPDGKLLVTGDLGDGATGPQQGLLARLNADGSQDSTFKPFLSDPDKRLSSVAIASDGHIIIGRGVGDIFTNPLLCLTVDGTVDDSFAPPLNGNPVRSVTVQPDGKLLVALGRTAGDCFYTEFPLLRLLPSGAIDPGFTPPRFWPLMPPSHIECFVLSLDAVLVQADGRIVVAGALNEINHLPSGSVARLTRDGAIDLVFSTPQFAGPWSYYPFPIVRCAAFQSDGSILVGGDLHLANGGPSRQGLMRFRPGDPVIPTASLGSPSIGATGHFQFVVQSRASESFCIEASNDFADWIKLYTNQVPQPMEAFIDRGSDLVPRRFYRIRPWQGP